MGCLSLLYLEGPRLLADQTIQTCDLEEDAVQSWRQGLVELVKNRAVGSPGRSLSPVNLQVHRADRSTEAGSYSRGVGAG